jgi:hypothetical protein
MKSSSDGSQKNADNNIKGCGKDYIGKDIEGDKAHYFCTSGWLCPSCRRKK